MHLLPFHRRELLNLIPSGGVAAEIGVAEGEFSREIVARNKPARLHLVDPWIHWEKEDYQPDPQNVAQREHDQRHDDIRREYAAQIAEGSVVVHRALSVPTAAEFPDGHFDWLFIDAMHTYEAVRDDLRAWAPKVKDDGILMGHDYANHPYAREMGFGVVEAVDEFLKEGGWTFLFLTIENFPTYVLARTPLRPKVEELVTRVLHHCPTVVEIAPDAMRYQQKTLRFADGSLKTAFAFS